MAILQLLRGSAAQWQEYDIVPADGEVALLRTAGGRTRIKIGNGTDPFSALCCQDGEVIKGMQGSQLTLRHGADHRLGTTETVMIQYPAVYDEDFFATVTFDSPSTPTSFSCPLTPALHVTGDAVTDGIFVPQASTHYTVLFWYDGGMQALVRGVALA